MDRNKNLLGLGDIEDKLRSLSIKKVLGSFKRFIFHQSRLFFIFVIISLVITFILYRFRGAGFDNQFLSISTIVFFILYVPYWIVKWFLSWARFWHIITDGKVTKKFEIVTTGDWGRTILAVAIAFVVVGIMCTIVYYAPQPIYNKIVKFLQWTGMPK